MAETADSLFTGSANINWGKGDKAKQWLPDAQGNLKWRGGTLLEIPSGKVQRRDFETGKPLFYDDGNAKQQIILTLQTNERDAGDFDDGVRRLYVPCDSAKPGTMYGEIVSALRRGGGGMKVGCQIYVAMVKMEPSQKKGGEDRRVWTAGFVPAPPESADGMFIAPEGGAAGNGAQVPNQPPSTPQGGYNPAPTQHQPPANQPVQQPQGNPTWQGGQQPQYQPTPTQHQPPANQPVQQPGNPYGGQPAGTPPGQTPSYAGAPAASNQPQWGPSGGPQEQYAPQQGQQAPGGYVQQGQPNQSYAQQPPANGNPYRMTQNGQPPAGDPQHNPYAGPGPVQQPAANQPQYAGNPYQQ